MFSGMFSLDTTDADLLRMGDPKSLGTVRALAANGAYSKALKHLTSEGMLDANSLDVLVQMQGLHPNGKPPWPEPTPTRSCMAAVDQALVDSLDDRLRRIMEIATSFHAASAAGRPTFVQRIWPNCSEGVWQASWTRQTPPPTGGPKPPHPPLPEPIL